jgi:hypothetical protein
MPENSVVLYKSCDQCVDEAEEALSLGVGDNDTRKVAQSSNMIYEKVRHFYNHISILY